MFYLYDRAYHPLKVEHTAWSHASATSRDCRPRRTGCGRLAPVSSTLGDITRLYGVGHSALKEGKVLFNDALNTFYLRLYGVAHSGLKEGIVLFNDALNTIYLRLYGVGHSGLKEGNILINDALNTFYLRLYGVAHSGLKSVSG